MGMYENLIESMNKKAIELLEQLPNCDGTGRKMRFVGGDVPILASNSKQLASSEWIPVTERLPEEDSKVLGVVKEEGYNRIAFVFYSCGRWWECFYNGFTNINVTHWMPLPEAPKIESI